MKKSFKILLSSSLLTLISINCQVKETIVENVKKIDLPVGPNHINLVLKENNQNDHSTLVARLRDDSCSDEANKPARYILIEVPFSTILDDYNAVYRIDTVEKSAEVLLNQERYQLKLADISKIQGLTQHVCSSRSNPSSGEFALESNEQVIAIMTLIANVAPDCKINTPSAKSPTKCSIVVEDPAILHNQLEALQTRMVQKWRRQPYLLTRKITLGLALTKGLMSGPSNDSVNVYCGLIKHSFKDELPFVYKGKNWQQRLCNEKDSRLLANILASEVVKEAQQLAEEIETDSALGTLILRMPSKQLPTQDLWVSLKLVHPEDQGLQSNFDNLETINLCWHPIYSSNDATLATALNMHMLDNMLASKRCARPMSQELKQQLSESSLYVIANISSETEFAISNGKAIVLRLPKGEYQYTINPQPSNISQWYKVSMASPHINGTLMWKGKHPVTTIRD